MPKPLYWPLATFGGYSLLYFCFLFHPGLLRYDDFGYIQSVIETWEKGWPFTHDWLAPYTAVSSSLSALCYWSSGNFPLSTWGLQSAFVLVNFALLYRLLKTRLSERDAAFLTLLFATQPVYWYKCAEFGGNVFTFTFVLLALTSYLKGKWPWFFIAAILAFANRQNSIALMILPLHHLWKNDLKIRKVILVAGMVLFTIAALFLHLTMNRSFAQLHSIYAGLDRNLAFGIVRSISIGIFTGLAFLSGTLWLLGASARKNFNANIHGPIIPGLATLGFLAIPFLSSLPLVDVQAPFLGSLDHAFLLQYLLIIAASVSFWTLDWTVLRWNAAANLALAFILITSLRGFWFDVYLLDVFLAVLIYVLGCEKLPGLTKASRFLIFILVLGQLGWTYAYKILLDKADLSIHIYEAMQREGRLDPENMTDATFGYAGWKLFDYYREVDAFTEFDGFLNHIKKDQVVLDTELPWRHAFKRPVPAGAEILQLGKTRIGFCILNYRVMNIGSETEWSIGRGRFIPVNREKYRSKPYPLNQEEWSQYLKERRRQ